MRYQMSFCGKVALEDVFLKAFETYISISSGWCSALHDSAFSQVSNPKAPGQRNLQKVVFFLATLKAIKLSVFEDDW